MVVLRLGSIDNTELKFVPTKKNFLEEYIKSMKQIEEYELTQTYKDGYKYRRYNDHGSMKYTRNQKNKETHITNVIEIDANTFDSILKSNNSKCIRKIRKYYNDGPYEIDIDVFLEPLEMTLVEVSSDKAPLDEYKPPRGFVNVTNNDCFENIAIFDGSIISNNLIIEGTDGVGKSVTIERLLDEGIVCQDRCMDVISNNMLFSVSMEDRVRLYQEYLRKINKKVIFMVNMDKEELERRIYARGQLSEFDLEAFKYNQLYLDTYNYMKERNMLEGKLFLIDVTGLTIEEQVEKVKVLK